jgi:superfamily II DNA or RNA helicase
MNKKAKCIREVSLFSQLKSEYKFDNKDFNPQKIKSDIHIISPKVESLLNRIHELDKEDLEKDGQLYKHIIYCDLDGTHGIKLVASALLAIKDYKLAYDHNFKLITPKPNETFGLLTGSTMFGKPLTVGIKKSVLSTINKRPDNIYGKNIRFLLLDNAFKEGIDVFDVKYHHILEPLLTNGEEKQIIGRGTRYCGQSGLPFDNDKGWQLHVYMYNMRYKDNLTFHDLYKENLNIDLSKLIVAKELDDLLKLSAIDKDLTSNIHLLEEYNKYILKTVKLLEETNKKTAIKQKDNFKFSLYGRQFNNYDTIDCKKGCQSALSAMNIELLIGLLLYREPKLIKIFNMKIYKPQICFKVVGLPKLCNIYNKIWLDGSNYLTIHYEDILKTLKHLENKKQILTQHSDSIKKYMKQYIPKAPIFPNPQPPEKKLSYYALNNYINFNYKKYKWDKIEKKNGCIVGGSETVNLTQSQNFIKDYFTPNNPYKGMLLYHSVGTGKTCTGIATASQSFQKEGYTIIWVTRSSLKQDVWKNMFEKVCHSTLKEEVKNGIHLEANLNNGIKTKLNKIGVEWVEPMSYKQFANLLLGKNAFYNLLKERNGSDDILKKTLIIIDEAHKLYTADLKPQERPDINIMKNLIQKSYEISGKNSVRLLLMTATPVTEDPLSSIKLLNMLDDKVFLPENYNEFKTKYCNEDGTIKNMEIYSLMNNFNGKISYLNRANDIRQFAYPVITDVYVNMSEGTNTQKENRILEIDNIIKETKRTNDNKDELNQMKKEKTSLKKLLLEDISIETNLQKCFEK